MYETKSCSASKLIEKLFNILVLIWFNTYWLSKVALDQLFMIIIRATYLAVLPSHSINKYIFKMRTCSLAVEMLVNKTNLTQKIVVNNLLMRVNTVDCLIVYLAVADLQQSRKPSMGKFHQHHNPAEHRSDGFPCTKK